MNSPKTKPSVLHEKSLHFAVEIVLLCEKLCERPCNFKLADQILRSGTSIGANLREATNAESSADFIHKLSIALKECGETLYWLDLLHLSNRIDETEFSHFKKQANGLHAMLTAAIKTMKRRASKSES